MINEINKLCDPITLPEYQSIAKTFQKLVELSINEIWVKHSKKVLLSLNDVLIGLEGSALNTSTAYGFMIEEFLVRQLPEFFTRNVTATNKSIEDFSYSNHSKIELMVNLKVEKNTSKNNGIVAGNILRERYILNEKPKLYLIMKSKYQINETKSELKFIATSSCYLESFITQENCLKTDRRNWTKKFNPLSGRLQLPNNTELAKCSIDSIPDPTAIYKFIFELETKLNKAKKP